jgi:hypothetical protein
MHAELDERKTENSSHGPASEPLARELGIERKPDFGLRIVGAGHRKLAVSDHLPIQFDDKQQAHSWSADRHVDLCVDQFRHLIGRVGRPDLVPGDLRV